MIAVVCTGAQKEELLSTGIADNLNIQWYSELVTVNNTTCYVDLLFDNSKERIKQLTNNGASIVIINHTEGRTEGLPPHFVCINAWPGFLNREMVECSSVNEEIKPETEQLFAGFNKKVIWLPADTGFISTRIIAMIVNEAYYALGEGVSTKDEIDIAMKLGTNYPYGPFEWAHKIGNKNIYNLLMSMAQKNARYTPCSILIKEALQ